MPYSDYSQRYPAIEKPVGEAICGAPLPYRGKHILRHCWSVATWCRGHCDASMATVIEVDMVGSNCSSADKTATAVIEQGCITASASAHQQRIGIGHGPGIDIACCKVFYGSIRLENAANIRNIGFNNYFHHTREYTVISAAIISSTAI